MRTLLTLGLLLTGGIHGTSRQPDGAASETNAALTQPAAQPVADAAQTPLSGKKNHKELVWAGATLRLGMTKTEALAEIGKSPKDQWFAVELDAPPYGELHKMDKWILAYGNPTNPDQGGGTVTLMFADEKLTAIVEGNHP